MEKTDRTSISRLAGRGSYDIHQINAILDEALLCTVSYVEQGRPFSIPTGFVRVGNQLVIHGSVGSHFMRQIADGRDLCVVITLLDGLVLARSIFDSSMNYRSVVLFSKAVTVDALEEKRKYFEAYTEKVLPGRWADV
ncbi:MAG TPA: pyridoxamine 5'-phosphate oxidase family protein [Luteibaculaceae bacterium]|nr:pyridoxamine 5'-phosphate oxidase family protein [Luteibaculaceae bacterium]